MSDTVKNTKPSVKRDPSSKKTEKKKADEPIIVSKAEGYKNHKIKLDVIDLDRLNQFNQGDEISVSSNELKVIGNHRWLVRK